MIKGILWAVSEIPGACIKKGRIFAEGKEVVFKKYNSDKSPIFDDYSVKHEQANIIVSGNNDRAKIFGLLELADQVKNGVQEDKVVNLKFLTRNYKHQSGFRKGERSIHNYTKAFWESLCHELLRHNFNELNGPSITLTESPILNGDSTIERCSMELSGSRIFSTLTSSSGDEPTISNSLKSK